jgi:hypothetical protein
MNQVAASILVLAGSICCYASLSRPWGDPLGGIVMMAAAGLGLWGGLSLLSSTATAANRMLGTPDDDHEPVPMSARPLINTTRGVHRIQSARGSSRHPHHESKL